MLKDIIIGLVTTAIWEIGKYLYILSKKNHFTVTYVTTAANKKKSFLNDGA